MVNKPVKSNYDVQGADDLDLDMGMFKDDSQEGIAGLNASSIGTGRGSYESGNRQNAPITQSPDSNTTGGVKKRGRGRPRNEISASEVSDKMEGKREQERQGTVDVCDSKPLIMEPKEPIEPFEGEVERDSDRSIRPKSVRALIQKFEKLKLRYLAREKEKAARGCSQHSNESGEKPDSRAKRTNSETHDEQVTKQKESGANSEAHIQPGIKRCTEQTEKTSTASETNPAPLTHIATGKSKKQGGRSSNSFDFRNLTISDDGVKQIPLKALNLEDETFQIRLSSEPDKTLKNSMRDHGIFIPLIVRPHPEKKGEYQLICGFRRASAAKSLEMVTVPAIIRELNDEDAQIEAYAENEYRKTLGDLDRACAMDKFRKFGKTTKEIASNFGLSERQVQRLEGLLKYPEELKAALKDDSTGITTTHALILMQAKRKHENEFDISEWLAKGIKSVNELKKEIRKEFSSELSRGTLIRRHESKISFDIEAIKAAETKLKEAAVKELEILLKELRG